MLLKLKLIDLIAFITSLCILRVYNVHIDKISKDRYNVVKLSVHMFTP